MNRSGGSNRGGRRWWEYMALAVFVVYLLAQYGI